MPHSPDADAIALFEEARGLLQERHDPVIHQVAAVVRAENGVTYRGLHLGSRRINVCAESSAMANAVMAGAGSIIAIVAVCRNDGGDIVVTNPCGVCRELMGTYAPDAEVMIDDRGTVTMVGADDLLPSRWMFPHENDWTPDDPRIA